MPGVDTKPEDSIRIRQIDPGKFEQGSFRTIEFKPGIKAVVGKLKGEDKTTVQTLIFEKEKFTEAEARAWIADHKEFHIMKTLEEQEKPTIILAQKSFGLVSMAVASPEQTSIFEKFKLLPGTYDIVFDEHGVPCDYLNVEIAGYASTFLKDAAGDQYFPQSFPDMVRQAYMRKPVLLRDHKRDDVTSNIGTILEERLDDYGWWVRARIDNSSSEAMKDLRAKIVQGTLNSFSISGLTVKRGGIDIFTRLDEVSVVWAGCNQSSVFAVKSLDGDSGKRSEKSAGQESGEDFLYKPNVIAIASTLYNPAMCGIISQGDKIMDLKAQIFAQKSLVLNYKAQMATVTEEKVKKDLGKRIQEMEQLIEEMEDEVMAGEKAKKEEAKKEEAKKAMKDEAEKEEAKKAKEKEEAEAKAKKEEAEKEEAKKKETAKKEEAEKEESKKKALEDLATKYGMTVEQVQVSIDAQGKKVAKSLGLGDMEPSKIFMPGILSGLTLASKQYSKNDREFVSRVEKSMKEHTNTGEIEMEFDNSDANIARLMTIAANPFVRKALSLDHDPARNKVAHIQANSIIAKALNGELPKYDGGPVSIHKALDGSAGSGDDLVPEQLSNILFIRLYGTAQVAPQLVPVSMDSERIKLGKVLSPAMVSGAPATGTVPESTFATDGDSDLMHSKDFEGYSYVYDNVQMDSVFNLITTLQQIHAIFLARQLDNALINGNASANIDNSYCVIPDGAWATIASRTNAGGETNVPVTSYWDGFRNLALNATGLNVDISSEFASAPTTGVRKVLRAMKRYATQQQAKNVCVIMGSGAIGAFRGDPQFTQAYAASTLLTLIDGIVDTYLGHKVLESYDMSEQLSADGNYNPSTSASQLLAGVLAFNRTQFALGIRKTQTFEILRDPKVRRSNVRSLARFGFAPLEPNPSASLPTVAYGYKVTV
jgi:hypothetical protein